MSEGSVDPKRRENLIKLGSAAVFLAIVAVAVLIVVSQSDESGGDAGSVEGAAEVREELAGIPQTGLELGNRDAAVKLFEFGDLQCPYCKAVSEDVIPPVIESKVRSGEAVLEFRNFTILGEESVDAAAAAIAAGEQDRGWDFVELFYRNQGVEASGYVTDEFLTSIARAAGVPDLARWDEDRASRATLGQILRANEEAERLGLSGTPSFVVVGPGADGMESLGTPGSAADLEAAIDEAG
jgi:protein-disulfide isomerase